MFETHHWIFHPIIGIFFILVCYKFRACYSMGHILSSLWFILASFYILLRISYNWSHLIDCWPGLQLELDWISSAAAKLCHFNYRPFSRTCLLLGIEFVSLHIARVRNCERSFELFKDSTGIFLEDLITFLFLLPFYRSAEHLHPTILHLEH